jgi:hypothetical protein
LVAVSFAGGAFSWRRKNTPDSRAWPAMRARRAISMRSASLSESTPGTFKGRGTAGAMGDGLPRQASEREVQITISPKGPKPETLRCSCMAINLNLKSKQK